jgi:hypothetical protein
MISHNKSQKNHQSLILLNQEGFCVFVPVVVEGGGVLLFLSGFVIAEFKEPAQTDIFARKNDKSVRNNFFIY